jgi:ABC-type transport system substrate-binding protein
MARENRKNAKTGLSRLRIILVVAIVLIVIGVSAYGLMLSTHPSSSTTTSGKTGTSTSLTSSQSTTSSTSYPNTLTWETPSTVDFLDPQVSYTAFSYSVLQNVYEPLLWYNGSCASCIIPWLAQNYTVSSDLKTYDFTLRSGITFADGELLNSTAVYFSFNRLLMEDGSTTLSHGTQASFILQQLLNRSLSTTLCGCVQNYNSSYENSVLGQDFVQITGALTFALQVQNPNLAFQYMLGDIGSDIVAPIYVMQNDLGVWNQSASGYSLPYRSLKGNESEMMFEYFADELATCNSGATPKGCGATYLDESSGGSLAGTGPYTLASFDQSSNEIVLKANPSYWGAPYQYLGDRKTVPKISTIDINYVPQQSTRLLDLKNAADSGQALTVDIEPDHLYDIANRNAWLSNGTLSSIIPGVSLYGPFGSFYTYFDAFSMNVTNPITGTLFSFQPFADLRFRLAFADSVNMSQINEGINNGLGQVAQNVVPPGLPPEGSSNSSIKPVYAYNTTAVQSLLLNAMLHPITRFTFVNGTSAPTGLFNNAFGCSSLAKNGQCLNPVRQTVTLTFYTGDTVDQTIFEEIASVVNNISSTYNMGLTVTVTPEPFGFMSTQGFSDELYMYMIGGWGDDYPWVTDFLGPMFAPGQTYPLSDGWNVSGFATLYNKATEASAAGNVSALIAASDEMNSLANQEVMYLWTFNPDSFFAITSNVQGFYFNPSLEQVPTGFYFASLY